ncbi:hypothetical protein, partial [Nakamurella lactea]|uniref:hypothetical protein n=1 Tax=Nakamurella lactea TaxID=459515 RepID=UPI0004048670
MLAGLRPFQRRTVDHVIRRFYGPDPTRRFLVADETGLGKSIVARGVIARAVEKLQDDPATTSIDVVYVCSNSDLARQNLARLNVTGHDAAVSPGRLAMLAATHGRIHRDDSTWQTPINLVSFTPGTSFNTRNNVGNAEERLLLLEILWHQLGLQHRLDQRAAYRVCQGAVGSWQRMSDRHLACRRSWGTLDPEVVAYVRAEAAAPDANHASLVEWLSTLIGQHRVGSQITDGLRAEAAEATRQGRELLIRSGLAVLEPNLVILDEFQRFKDLLNTGSDAGELAEQLFGHPKAKVLLLSATPFKAFTLAEERDQDDHQQDMFDTLEFLAKGGTHHSMDEIKAGLRHYRTTVLRGESPADQASLLRHRLLPLMSRTERPAAVQQNRVREVVHRVDRVTADDLLEFARLDALAGSVEAHMTVEYWKSAPYFANFMDGYQVHTKTRTALQAQDPDVVAQLRIVRRLPRSDIEQRRPVDLGNGKLRELAAQTTGAGWERLLWVPPTLPYTTPGGPFGDSAEMTKRLIFSSWMATPTAVASLLSYDADRRLAEFGRVLDRRRQRARLTYRMQDGRAASMSTLALFWPVPALARLGDPLATARSHGEAVNPQEVLRRASGVIAERFREPGQESAASELDHWYWATALTFDKRLPVNPAVEAADIAGLMSSGTPADDDPGSGSGGARAHVEALAALEPPSAGNRPPELADTVAALACFGPANAAWRALRRLVKPGDAVTERTVWEQAVRVAEGLRSLFNRPEAMNLLDGLYGSEPPYWRAVLRYCADGNLQAMLDEYAYQLAAERPGTMTEATLADIAAEMSATPALRRATFRVFDPDACESTQSLDAAFAMRYGDRTGSTTVGARPQEVRQSFNSPFWPFVLASTSVGQEGIDFHHWCHSLVHWNIPANPIDFEQREGRIDRFRGHAVRRNVIADLGRDILRIPGNEHPWDVAYRLAEERSEQRDQLYGSWLYDGPAKIERTLFEFPFSKDEIALQQVKRDLALYRLAFGQGRQ